MGVQGVARAGEAGGQCGPPGSSSDPPQAGH